MGACKADLRLDTQKEVYTSGDIVRGRLVVTLTKDLSINEIIIKFKGKTKVTIGEGEYRSAMIATLFHAESQVFPPPHLAEQQMSRLTLLKGIYEYPFEFQVPGHGDGSMSMLLPTFSIDFNRIFVRYYVKATVRRASRLAVNTRAEQDIRTTPCMDRQLLQNYSLATAKESIYLISGLDTIKAKLTEASDLPTILMEFRYPKRGLRPSGHEPLDLGLSITKTSDITSPIALTGASIYLYRCGVFKTDVAEAKTNEKVVVDTLRWDHIVDFDGGDTADLSDLVSNVRLKTLCLPSFSSRLIDIQYEVGILVSMNTDRGKRKIELRGHTTILPISVHDHSGNSDELPTYKRHTEDQLPPAYTSL